MSVKPIEIEGLFSTYKSFFGQWLDLDSEHSSNPLGGVIPSEAAFQAEREPALSK
jgi:hypothetical protein